MTMDERKNRVLQAIVDDYVATAEPVGSRTIARKYRLGVSPATIRNEMADLEELGYLEQPHTSAGRIPSDRGYRYYVDCLMEVREASADEQERIRRTFERKVWELETLIRETARALSDLTNLTGVVVGPQPQAATFREIRFVPLAPDRALLVYITDTGFVENAVVDLPFEVTMLELQTISSLLTEQLQGQRLELLGRGALQLLQRELHQYGRLLEQSLEFLAESMQPGDRKRHYLSGTTHLLEQPEFRDIQKARTVFTLLEQETVLDEVLSLPDLDKVQVQIGEEIKVHELQDCSIISATYTAGNRTIGRIGVIGPRRMDYGRVIALVDEVTRRLTSVLGRQRLVE